MCGIWVAESGRSRWPARSSASTARGSIARAGGAVVDDPPLDDDVGLLEASGRCRRRPAPTRASCWSPNWSGRAASPPRSAASGSTTTGCGSYSTITFSAASTTRVAVVADDDGDGIADALDLAALPAASVGGVDLDPGRRPGHRERRLQVAQVVAGEDRADVVAGQGVLGASIETIAGVRLRGAHEGHRTACPPGGCRRRSGAVPVISRGSSLRLSARPTSGPPTGSSTAVVRQPLSGDHAPDRRALRRRAGMRDLAGVRMVGRVGHRLDDVVVARCSGRGCPRGPWRISSSVGSGLRASRSAAAMIIPGVQ